MPLVKKPADVRAVIRMKLRSVQIVQLALCAAACSPNTGSGDLGATGGAASVGGSGGTAAATGGSPSGGAATGGSGGGAGGTPTGGTTATGGGGTGGTATGGAASGGTASGGAENLLDIAADIDGLRVDDPCTGTPAVSVGATCDHVVLTGAGFVAEQEVSIGGAPGTTYAVTVRVRGVTEPTNVSGGERPSTETFSYMDLDWRTEPLTIGGTVPVDDADYSQWSITVGEPAAVYTLNDYQRVGHYIFELDYEVTLPMQAGTTLTLAGVDANERLILNYESYAPEGIDGSMNHGQFVELELVSVSEQ